ncbi:MAG TPA: amidohydrolase family protein [Vicinamibacterales bacterium]|nr:amidohydrolase family protein [Vicinamibacterales bacterium]
MKTFLAVLAASASIALVGVELSGRTAGHASPGQIRPRPAEGRDPEFRPPTIREYKPKSQLVTPEHPVARAKFPVIDIHSHQSTPISAGEFDRVMKGMEANNLQILVNLSGSWGDRLRQGIDAIRTSKYKDRMVLFANVNFRDVGPGWGKKAARQLEDDINAGAMGLKVFKDLGMFDRKADGSRLQVDDPEIDPVWETCARLNVPVLIHIAEPAAFFEPLDYINERWLELSLYPDRRHQTGVRFEQLMTERNNMIRRHPNTKFILAHFGWHASDLARAGKLLDQNPNVFYDVAAVLYDFGRQPRAAHDFFIKYQDRILFGKDSYQPDEYPYYWRVFETNDEYFDYYRDYHAFWKLYGIGLPDQVLRKLYNGNALKLVPRLPHAAFDKSGTQ